MYLLHDTKVCSDVLFEVSRLWMCPLVILRGRCKEILSFFNCDASVPKFDSRQPSLHSPEGEFSRSLEFVVYTLLTIYCELHRLGSS